MKCKCRGVALLLICSFIFSFTIIHPVTGAEAKYEEAVETLYYLGLINDSPRDFDTEMVFTRAEFVSLLFPVMGLDVTGAEGLQVFRDIPDYHWAAGAINTAYHLGIVKGFDKPNFIPENPITYEQALTLLVDIVKETGFGKVNKGEIQKGITILSERLEIRKGTGIIAANGLSSLYGPGGVGANNVEI